MNLGRYIKAIAPAIIGVMSPVEDWGLTGRLDWPHERFALVMLGVAAIVYWLPNTPAPADPTPEAEPPSPNERYIGARLATDAGSLPLGGRD